jgi:effector-binding domain-containing protein
MKIIIIFIICIVCIILFQSFIIMSTNKTEEQKYSIIKDYGGFEIRFYPSSNIATINSNAKTYRELANPGFRKLAGYIFGDNEANQKISMTTPVHMDINDSISKMSFVMPSAFKMENLPKPNDSNVNIKKIPDEYVAVIKFSGFASDKDIKLYSEKLQTLLKDNNINAIGNYRLYGYNPPYQFINRRNEIVVTVEWKE